MLERAFATTSLILGGLLFLSPWTFRFVSEEAASRNAWLCGLLIGMLSLMTIMAHSEWKLWISVGFGLRVLGYQDTTSIKMVHAISGFGVAALSAMARDNVAMRNSRPPTFGEPGTL
jgi:SPW repeat-containing protein